MWNRSRCWRPEGRRIAGEGGRPQGETKTGIYNPKTAQELANERKEHFSRKRVFNQEKKSFVIHAIKEDNWSAEQIVGYCRENNIPMVGKTTIYEFIHQDKKKGSNFKFFIAS